MRVWTLEEALEALPEVRVLVHRLTELAEVPTSPDVPAGMAPVSGNGHGPGPHDGRAELREVLEELTERGIIVRDPARGLIDFPAQTADGRTYLLCWLDGEDTIDWWHWPEDGFAGRTPLSEPPE